MISHRLNKDKTYIVRDIIFQNISGINKASLYGSRSTGKYKSNSGIDLVLYSNIDEAKAGRLRTCFYESLLPYKVDVTIYQHITHPPFFLKHDIDEQSKTLFTKE